MWRRIRRVVLWSLLGFVLLFGVLVALNWNTVHRVALGGLKVYETTPPQIPANLPRPAILVFSKTNGFRHEEAIPMANALFAETARANGWGYFQTENGATFQPDILARFDAVVFNNVSGDVFTPPQREALETFIERGGGFVGIHGSGGDISYDWRWYVEKLIGAQFAQHTLNPQFQEAVVTIEDRDHPVTRGLPHSWRHTEEWYSFSQSPRREGYGILISVDEKTYQPKGMFGKDLRMGDHPVVWWHCVGQGRALYSALGHRAETYAEPEHRTLLQNAVRWALLVDGRGCGSAASPDQLKARN